MTLRRTLILSVLGLIALAGIVIGLVSTLALNSFLLNQLDAQVREASNRTMMSLQQGPRPELSLGQASGTMVAVVSVVTAIGLARRRRYLARILQEAPE